MTPEPKPSKLALALRKKFRTPREAPLVLGLDPILLAQDKKGARDEDNGAQREQDRRARSEREAEENHEAAEETHSDKLVRILKFLDGKLSPDDYNKVAGMVDDNPTGNFDPQAEREDSEREAKDSRTRLPRPGGRMGTASDSASRDDYGRRFPHAAKIQVIY
jgi:hypothetical protein